MNHTHQLNKAPSLVEISRGIDVDGAAIAEIIHRGLVAVVDGLGRSLLTIGDDTTRIHLRSCAKPVQLLPLIESNGLGAVSEEPYDRALLMSSHTGARIHTERVKAILAENNLDETALRCGIHPPHDDEARRELHLLQQKPSTLHNNCSGKHTAMILACRALDLDEKNYDDVDHELQRLIKKHLATLGDLSPDLIGHGIDGCSLPSWVMPIKNIALIYARMAYWQTPNVNSDFYRRAFVSMWQSAIDYPEYLSGDGKLDCEVIRFGHGAIFSKTGADGMHALSFLPCNNYPHGLGVVIKIVDGDLRQTTRALIIKQVLDLLGLSSTFLKKFLPLTTNHRGLTTCAINVSRLLSHELKQYE